MGKIRHTFVTKVREFTVRKGRREVHLTHLDRVFWPEAGLTKADLVDYYTRIAPVLLPHVRNRPFTIKRHYTVPRGPFAWEKDAPPDMPDWIPVSPQPAKARGGELVRYPLDPPLAVDVGVGDDWNEAKD